MTYLAESWTVEERTRLSRYTSNQDAPVFALCNLPEATKAALFARYSRTSKSLRRLLLDEFLETGTEEPAAASAGASRASELFARVIGEFGDDSVAQLGGVHIACEQASQLLLKKIEWGRLMAYLEQSTRYIPYTDKPGGQFRYYRGPEILETGLQEEYQAAQDNLFELYSRSIQRLRDHLEQTIPQQENTAARTRAIRALALDIARSLLPIATVSNVGIYGSAQSLEQLVLRLRADSLPEAQRYAELINQELQRTMPDLVSRLDRPDRGGVWVQYLAGIREALAQARPDAPPALPEPPSVRLLSYDKDAEVRILTGALYPYGALSWPDLERHIRSLTSRQMDDLFLRAVGERRNRRHKPGRGFEECHYRFEIVSDYGAFRDLQRHRMLTIQWQEVNSSLGFTCPLEVIDAGLESEWRDAVGKSEVLHGALLEHNPLVAPYVLTLGHRIRYSMTLSAREAIHLIELRTSPQGHRSYRDIAREMYRQIRDVAGHRRLAAAMQFVDQEDIHLPRYASEARMQPLPATRELPFPPQN